MAIKISIKANQQDHFIVAIAGRLDSETAPQCEAGIKHLLAPATKSLTFDLRELDYISSAGLRILVKAMKALESHKGVVRIKNAQAPVAKVIEIADLIPADVAASEKSADIFLDAVQRKEAKKKQDVSD